MDLTNTMKENLVSVIMPVYNGSNYLSEAITSVIVQSYSEWELVIVNDGSTEDISSIVERFEEHRIRYFTHHTRKGAAEARNTALREAQGQWIAFLDSDDVWEKDKLTKQIGFMKQHGYAFSYTCYVETDELLRTGEKTFSGPQHIGKRLMHVYCWPGCLTVMYDASRVGLVQIAPIETNNDYALWLEVVKHVDCYLLKECLAKRRRRSGSLSDKGAVYKMVSFYNLFRVVDKMNVLMSASLTIVNVICYFLKKTFFVKQEYVFNRTTT